MLNELAHFSLILAFGIAVVQMIVPMIGAHTGRRSWMAIAEPAATSQVILVSFSFGVLIWAFVQSDFSLSLVYENSHTAKPLIYKISGVWGNHEGSMLLWVLILTIFGASAAWFGGGLPDKLRAGLVRAGRDLGRILPLYPPDIQPVHTPGSAAAERSGLEPVAARPGLGLSPAVPVFGLCRA